MNNLLKLFFLLFFFFSISISRSQDVTSELGFSLGTGLPSDEMEAKAGLGFQLDYRLMRNNFGLQFSMNYLQNPMNEEDLMAQLNASAANTNPWLSFSGMLKLVGRITTVQNKLLFDISAGFGVMQSYFPDQNYTYDQNSPNNYTRIASEANTSSSFVFGAGLRVHYRFREDASVGVSYDLQAANQNYSIKGTKSNATTETIFSGINMNYSNLLIGVNFFF